MFTRAFDTKSEIQKSPKVEGIIQGAKAAVIAAPIAAAIQALRNKNPIIGGVLAGLAAGATVGAGAAAMQNLRNTEIESDMRYHLGNIQDDANMDQYQQPVIIQRPANFTQGFQYVRNPYENPYL